MTDRKTVVGAVICATSWIVGYIVTKTLGDGMSAVSAYAVLVGWWFTAYTSSVFQVPIKAAIPLAGIFLILFFVAALAGNPWFYRDVSSLTLLTTCLIGLAQATVIVSPILFNCAFRRIVQIFPSVKA